MLRAVRPHQWAKNLLLFVPAIAAHREPTTDVFVALAAGFVSFSLLASAVYLGNDVADIEHDRAHPTKRLRPIAAGTLSTRAALAAAAALVVVSLALALRLPRDFLWAWTVYLVATTAYSGGLKRRVVLDVVILSGLFTVRVIAGAAAVTVPLSRWFLAFSIFVFTSLALLKRAVESRSAQERERKAIGGRGWRVEDLPVLVAMGIGCAVAASLVFCLYITGEDVTHLYDRPDLLWMGLPVLLYWMMRAWLLALRGEVSDDPVVFALKDPASYACLLVFAVAVWGAV